MNNYLLEVGVEEFPAKYIESTKNQFYDKFKKLLLDNEISFEDIKIESTPRRFAILLENMSMDSKDEKEIVKGPSKDIALDGEGEPTKALLGFLRSKGLSKDDIYFESDNKGKEYVYAEVKVKTLGIDELLSKEVPNIVSSISNPRAMKWGGKNIRFLRPIRWFLSLYNDKVLDFDLEGIPVSNVTRGHRFLGKDRIVVDKIENYSDLLRENYVIISEKERRNIIIAGINRLTKSKGGNPLMDEDLLDEVVHIVEYPTPFIGTIKDEYLELPKEVIITTMKDHQRYFPVLNDNGDILPYFISVRNGDEKGIENVISGNEKVITPRLEDAKFFYNQDLESDIEDEYNKLKFVTFHDGLGNLQDKTERLMSLTNSIGTYMQVSKNTLEDSLRAAELSKVDLVSKMVIEFTELEGTMGRIYALKYGENSSVASAIEEQYMPRRADGELPESTAGVILSLADKIDTISGLYAIGIEVTGSQDPYGLRRQVIGFINIVIENKISIDLYDLIDRTLINYLDQFNLVFDHKEVRDKIVDFFMNRLRNKLIDDGYRYDIIDSCIDTDTRDIYSIYKKIILLDKYFKEDGSEEFVTSSLRLKNLSRDVEISEVDEDLLEDSEIDMFNLTKNIKETESKIDNNNYEEALEDLIREMDVVNNYLDNNIVNVDDERVSNNRALMLEQVSRVVEKLYNPSKIVRE